MNIDTRGTKGKLDDAHLTYIIKYFHHRFLTGLLLFKHKNQGEQQVNWRVFSLMLECHLAVKRAFRFYAILGSIRHHQDLSNRSQRSKQLFSKNKNFENNPVLMLLVFLCLFLVYRTIDL